MLRMLFAIIHLAVLQMPMGWMPGFLSRAMRWQAMSGAILAGSTISVLRRFAVKARERQGSDEAALKDVHSLLHASASRPEGPAAPLVCSAAYLIASASIDSKRTRWVSYRSSHSVERLIRWVLI